MLNQQDGIAVCKGCNKLQQELDQCKTEHTLKYTTLKQKIMLVDELIRQYQAKTQENSLLKNKLEELANRLSSSRKDCKVLEEQLSNTLREIIPIRSENGKLKLENKQLKKNAEKYSDEQLGNEASCRQLRDLLSKREAELQEELQMVTLKLNNNTNSDLKNLAKVKEDNLTLKKDNSQIKRMNYLTNNKLTKSKNRERQLRELLLAHGVSIPRLKRLDKGAAKKGSDSSEEDDEQDSEALQELINTKISSVSMKISQSDQGTQTIAVEELMKSKQNVDDRKATSKNDNQQTTSYKPAENIKGMTEINHKQTRSCAVAENIRATPLGNHKQTRSCTVYENIKAIPEGNYNQTSNCTIAKRRTTIKSSTPCQLRGSRRDSVFRKLAAFDMRKMPVCLSPIPISPCRNRVKNLSESSASGEDDCMSVIADQIDIALEKCQDSQDPQDIPSMEILNQVEDSITNVPSLEIPNKVESPTRKSRKKHIDTPQRMTRSRTRNFSSSCKENNPVLLPKKVTMRSCKKIKSKSLSDTSDDEHKENNSKSSVALKKHNSKADKSMRTEEVEISQEKNSMHSAIDIVPCATLSVEDVDQRLIEPLVDLNTSYDEHIETNTELKEFQNIILNVNTCGSGDEGQKMNSEREEASGECNVQSDESLAVPDKMMEGLGHSGSNIIGDLETSDMSQIDILRDDTASIPDGNNDSTQLNSPVDDTTQDNNLADCVEEAKHNELQDNKYTVNNDVDTGSLEEPLTNEYAQDKCTLSEFNQGSHEDPIEKRNEIERNVCDDRNNNSELCTDVLSNVSEEIGTNIGTASVPEGVSNQSPHLSSEKGSVGIDREEKSVIDRRKEKEAKSDYSDGKLLEAESVIEESKITEEIIDFFPCITSDDDDDDDDDNDNRNKKLVSDNNKTVQEPTEITSEHKEGKNVTCDDELDSKEQKPYTVVNVSNLSESNESLKENDKDLNDISIIDKGLRGSQYSSSTNISDVPKLSSTDIDIERCNQDICVQGLTEEISGVKVTENIESPVEGTSRSQSNILTDTLLQNDSDTSIVEGTLAKKCEKSIESCIVKPVIFRTVSNKDPIEAMNQTDRIHFDKKSEVHITSSTKHADKANIAASHCSSVTAHKVRHSLPKLYSSFVKASVLKELEIVDEVEEKRINKANTDGSNQKVLRTRCCPSSSKVTKVENHSKSNTVSEISTVLCEGQSDNANFALGGEYPDKVDNSTAEIKDLVTLPQRRLTRSMSDVGKVYKTPVQTLKRQLSDVDHKASQKKPKKSVSSNELKKSDPSRITRSMKGNRTEARCSNVYGGSSNLLAPLPELHSADVSEINPTSSKSLNILPNNGSFSGAIPSVLLSLERNEPVKCAEGTSTNNAILGKRLKMKCQSMGACKSLQFDATEKDQSNKKFDAPLDNVAGPSRRSNDNSQPSQKANRQSRSICAKKEPIQMIVRPSLVSPIPASPLTLLIHPPRVSPMSLCRGSTPTLNSLTLPSLTPLPNPITPLPISPRKSSLRNGPSLHRLPVLPISPLTLPSTAKRSAPGSSFSLAPRLSPLLDAQPNAPVPRSRRKRIAHRPAYSPDVPNMVPHKSDHNFPSSPVSPPRIHASVPEGAVNVKPSRSTDRLSSFRCPTPEMVDGNHQEKSRSCFAASSSFLKITARRSSFSKPVDSNFKTTAAKELKRKSASATCTDQQSGHIEMKHKCVGLVEDNILPVVSQQQYPEAAEEQGEIVETQDKDQVMENHQGLGNVNGNIWCQVERSRVNHGKTKRQTRKKKKDIEERKKISSVEVQRLKYQVDAERALGINVDDRLEFLVSQISNVTNDATAARAASRLVCFLILNHVNLLPVLKAMCNSGNTSTKLLVTPHEEMLIQAIAANQTFTFAGIVLYHLKQALFSLKEMEITDDNVSIAVTLCRCYAAICRCKGLAYADHVRILLYDIINQKVDNLPYLVLSIVSVWSAVLQMNTSSSVNATVKIIVLNQLQRQIEEGQYNAIILHHCFKRLYDWSVVVSESFGKVCLDLVNKLRTEEGATVSTNADGDSILSPATYDLVKAVELVASQLSWEWIKGQLIEQTLWPVVEYWRSNLTTVDESKEGLICAVLQIIGELSTLGLSSNLESVKNMLKNIGTLLQSEHQASVSWKTQLFIMKTLMRLSPGSPQIARRLIGEWLSESNRPVPVILRNAIAALAGDTTS